MKSSLKHDQQNDSIEDISNELEKVLPSIAENDNESKEVVNDSEKQAENQPENQPENQVETLETPEKMKEKIGKGPDKKAIKGVIGGAAYKTLTSVLGVKTITDLGLYGLGWLGQEIGWKTAEKIAQKSDLYQWSTQSSQSKKDRQKVALKIKNVIDNFYFYKNQRDTFLRGSGFDIEKYKQEMEDLVKKYKEKTPLKALDELSEDEKSAVEEIKSKISSLRQTKDDVLKNFSEDKNNTVSSSACEYNKSLKSARSSEYYALSKEQKEKVDQDIDKMFEEKKGLLEERAKLGDDNGERKKVIDSRIQEIEQNKYLPDQTMNKRLVQIIAKNEEKTVLDKKLKKEIDSILKDYIHSKVAFSSLVKDGLNTAFVLVGGPAAGAFRGLTYGGLALAERYQKNEQEYRKKYSWNEVGEKIGFGTKMHDLFIGSIKETWAGINGKKYQETYQLDEKGKLNRQEENQNIENNLQRYGAKAKAIGEVFRLFGIGTQAITAGITDGVNFKHAAEGFAKTFTEGNFLVNVGKNWYDNFRIDQRIAKACGRLFGREASTTINANNVDNALNEVAPSSGVSNGQKTGGQIMDDLMKSKLIVPKGGSVSGVLGKNVDLKKGIVLFISKGQGQEPEIIEDYNPSNIQPGVRLWEKNDQIYALDENSNNLSYYQAHSEVEILKPTESQDYENIIAEAMKPKATVVSETSEIPQVSEDLQTQEASQIPEAPAAVKPEIVLDEPVVSQPSEETEADIVKTFEATQTTSPEATVVSQAPQDLEFQGASVVPETSPTVEPEVAVSESGIDESVLVEPSQQEQASIVEAFKENQTVQNQNSFRNLETEDFIKAVHDSPSLVARDTTYQSLAEAAEKNDQTIFENFVLSDRPGKIISSSNDQVIWSDGQKVNADYLDLDSDIERIYYTKELTNDQKIDIFSKIKEELDGLTDKDNNLNESDDNFLANREHYSIIKQSVEDDIAILKGEYAPKAEISKDVPNLSSTDNKAIDSFADMDSNNKALETLVNPKASFSEVKDSLVKAIPDNGNTNSETAPVVEPVIEPKPEVAVSESGIDESVLVEPSQQEQASIAKVFEEGQAIQKPKSLNDWKIEDYKDALYGPLAAKDTTYQQVAEAAGKKDSEFFEKFILSDRPGGIISNMNEDTDYQDFDSDIDRIYHSNNLDKNQKIEILENIKNGLDNPKLTAHIENLSLRDHVERQYGILKDSVENDIAILKREYVPKAEISKDVPNLSSTDNKAIDSFADMDSNDKAFETLVNPDSSFSNIKSDLLKAIPDKGKTDVGGITFSRIGDNVYDKNGNLLTENNYQQVILEQAGALNQLTASDEFKKLSESSQSISAAISEDLGKEAFASLDGSINSYNKFIDPGAKFDEKIASLKSVLDNKQSMKVNDLTFARLNDKIYLVTDTKKVIELKDKAVIDDLLAARQAAMKVALENLQTSANK